MFKNASIGHKLYIAGAVMAALLIALTVVSGLNVRHGIHVEVEKSLLNLVELGGSTLSDLHNRAEAGELSMEDARAEALSVVESMRFEGDNYFFIVDSNHTMVMHAVRPQLNGQSMFNNQDPNGVYLFRDMVRVATQDGQGFVDYDWPRAGSDAPVPKRSAVLYFEPWDMVVGAGVYVDDVNARIMSTIGTMALGNLAVILILFAGAYFLNRSIEGPVSQLCDAVERLSQGDLHSELPEAEGLEVSKLTASVKVLQQSAQQRERLEQEAAEHQKDQIRRAEQIGQLVSAFDSNAAQAISAFEKAGDQLRRESSDLKKNAEDTSQGAQTLDGAASTSSESVEVVAAAAEELTAAISEINQQSLRSSDVSKQAVQQAERTREDVQKLAEAAQKIDGIVQLIAGVTEQTNLLALNATIEAARAGEAGKGFAVVASEVKALADQTATATESIVAEIKGIQQATDQSVNSIEGISRVIGETYEIATAISAAMEEQRAAASEIAHSAQRAAEATAAVGAEVGQAKVRAQHANTGAASLDQASVDVASQASGLKGTIERFLDQVRAA